MRMSPLFTAVVALALAAPGLAQRKPDAVPTVKTTAPFLAAFRPAVEPAARSTVRLRVDGKEVALGTVVARGGRILTKASEIRPGRLTIQAWGGTEWAGAVTATNEAYDLALVEIPGADLQPVAWTPSAAAPVGNWVAVPGPGPDAVAAGVVSVAARTIQYRPFLGVHFDPKATGLLVVEVVANEAAAKAGVRPKDEIVAFDGQAIAGRDALFGALRKHRIGDAVAVTVERDGKRLDLKATLGGLSDEAPPPGKSPSRGDLQNAMGSALSERRTGFATILQHDAVVRPTDCGGPLVDLEGAVIGLNICRAGRTETHAIPAEVVAQLLPALLAAKDRPIEVAPPPRVVR